MERALTSDCDSPSAGQRAVFEMNSPQIEQTIEDDSHVVARRTQTVRHVGSMLNVPLSGKTVRFTGITTLQVECGLVVERPRDEDFWGIAKAIDAA